MKAKGIGLLALAIIPALIGAIAYVMNGIVSNPNVTPHCGIFCKKTGITKSELVAKCTLPDGTYRKTKQCRIVQIMKDSEK